MSERRPHCTGSPSESTTSGRSGVDARAGPRFCAPTMRAACPNADADGRQARVARAQRELREELIHRLRDLGVGLRELGVLLLARRCWRPSARRAVSSAVRPPGCTSRPSISSSIGSRAAPTSRRGAALVAVRARAAAAAASRLARAARVAPARAALVPVRGGCAGAGAGCAYALRCEPGTAKSKKTIARFMSQCSERSRASAAPPPPNSRVKNQRTGRLPSMLSVSEYATGTTIKVSNVEVIRPPITQIAIGARVSPPSLMASATGIMPKIIAAVVIRIGRRRIVPALTSASCTLAPSAAQLVGEVDEQDRVLRDQAHQHDHADHREDVERLAGEVEPAERADHRQRQRQHDRERLDEAVELRREDHVDEHDREEQRDAHVAEALAHRVGHADEAGDEIGRDDASWRRRRRPWSPRRAAGPRGRRAR